VATAAKKPASTTAADTAKPKTTAKPKAVARAVPKATPKAAVAKPSPRPITKPVFAITCDADLLKMSEADYMNEAQMTYFKAKLETMRDEILDNARETGEHLKENEVFADPNDRATVEEENMLEQRVRDRERKLLKKITTALARIADGSYGYCLETGDPIGIPRLLARPTAELSIEAQEKHERLEKLYAD
jgi:DnaK suppressor protein